jgi:hypothetical protein
MNTGGEWFRITAGQHAGRLHLSGWMNSAIKGEATSPQDNGWVSYAHCPVCAAMVLHETQAPGQLRAYGDLTWDHERWHARTDHPVPPGLLTDDDIAAGYGAGHDVLPPAEVGTDGRYRGRCSCGWRGQVPRSSTDAASADTRVHVAEATS